VRFLDALGEHAADIYDNDAALLLPAIAVYGELLRTAMGGAWLVSRTLPGRELVVARRRQPWTRRRVILEVLDVLSR
jgi:hypothetical protein